MNLAVFGERRNSIYRQGLLDEHDGYVPPDRVKKLAVGANQAGLKLFLERLARPISQCAGGDLAIEPVKQRGLCQVQLLVRLRAAQYFEQLDLHRAEWS
jgi:hypothetical protein